MVLPKGGRVEGAIVIDQIKSMVWREIKEKKIEAISAPILEEVLAKIATLVT